MKNGQETESQGAHSYFYANKKQAKKEHAVSFSSEQGFLAAKKHKYRINDGMQSKVCYVP